MKSREYVFRFIIAQQVIFSIPWIWYAHPRDPTYHIFLTYLLQGSTGYYLHLLRVPSILRILRILLEMLMKDWKKVWWNVLLTTEIVGLPFVLWQ